MPAVSESVAGRRIQDELAVVVMRYAPAPIGWWQDSKGRMQPPGSFSSPSLRVPPEDDAATEGVTTPTAAARGRFKKRTVSLLPHNP